MTSTDTLWLTPAAHERLTAELTQLEGAGGAGPQVQARIGELRDLLRRAEIGDKPDDGLVEPGMTVTVIFDGDDEPTTFLFGPRTLAETDPDIDVQVYPPESPLGSAIDGLFTGDAFAYPAPSGAEVRGRIVAATPFRG